jgi:hypothetical protein
MPPLSPPVTCWGGNQEYQASLATNPSAPVSSSSSVKRAVPSTRSSVRPNETSASRLKPRCSSPKCTNIADR